MTYNENCIACNGNRWQTIDTPSGAYRKCRLCNHHIQLSARVGGVQQERFEEEQSKNYESSSVIVADISSYIQEQRHARRIRLLQQLLPSGKLLEVGPGAGVMLASAQKLGYYIDAVEHSNFLAAHIDKTHTIRVRVGQFEKLDIPASSYDAFMSFHVVEHVPDVRAHLVKAAEIVRPGGYAIIATPCADSWEHRVARGLSPNYSTAHLQLFSKRSMRMLLEESGWELITVSTPSYGEYWIRVMTSVLRKIHSQNGAQGNIPRGAFANASSKKLRNQLVVLKIIDFITFPVRWVQEQLGFGNELLVVAKRKGI